MDSIPQPYVINLSHRNDRWQEVQEEFKKLDLIPYRFNAIYNKEKGVMGCMASHIKVLKELTKTNIPVWISEDDIQFLQPKNQLLNLIEDFLKSDGDILCLANNTSIKVNYNEIFDRALSTDAAASYIIKQSFLPILLQLWEEIYDCAQTGKTHITEHLFQKRYCKCEYFNNPDISWKVLQPYYKFLIPKLCYAVQRESFSDIEHKIVNHK